MRYERLILEAGGSSLTLDLHPRLTVVAGVGSQERHALSDELVGALRSNRTGVHLEAVDDSGRHLAVFRPLGGRARVIDVDGATDVTGEFLDDDGFLDLLRPTGLDLATTRRKLVFDPADLQAEQHGKAIVRQLAAADEGELWITAERLLRAERTLDEESHAVGASAGDAGMIERIEERHLLAEQAFGRHQRIRRMSLAICAAGLVGALSASLRDSGFLAIPLLLAACASMIGAVYTRNRSQAAEAAERDALAEAGAASYLGFHMQRVDGMLRSDNARKRLVEAAAAHRQAAGAWHTLAGDVSAVWALDHYEEIAAAAAARRQIDLRATDGQPVDLNRLEGGDPAHVLIDRITEVSRLGAGTESYPLILDDPFAALDPSARPAILELLSRVTRSVQLIYLTNDEEIASWARLEALTGTLSIVEPASQRATKERLTRPS